MLTLTAMFKGFLWAKLMLRFDSKCYLQILEMVS